MRWSQDRKKYHRNSYGTEWPAISATKLKKDPFCQCIDPDCKCGGSHNDQRIPASEVDHIATISLFPKTSSGRRAAHSDDNLRSLCGSCHKSKTMRIDVHGRKGSSSNPW